MQKVMRTAVVACIAVAGVVMFSTVAAASEPDLGLSWVETSPVISFGDHGPSVAEWQDLLNHWSALQDPENPFRLATDGEFGSLTDGLTRSFQSEQGVPVDGIVGPVTRAAYLSAPALAGAEPDPAGDGVVVAVGDTGSSVAAWQAQVNRWTRAGGSDQAALVIDGVFGVRTEALTRVFQEQEGITVDGIVGPETLAAMISAPVIANPSGPSGLAPAESAAPAAGVCSDASGPTATLVMRADVPSPRCLRVTTTQQLELVNASSDPITVEIGTRTADVPVGASVTVWPPFGAFLAPGVHTVHVSIYAGAGPQIWLTE